MFQRLKNWLVAGQLNRLFSRDNLTQPSTIKGVLRLLISAGVFTLSPEVVDSASQAIAQIFAAGWLAIGVIDTLRNEKKSLPWLAPK